METAVRCLTSGYWHLDTPALALTKASASIGPQASGWTGHSVSPPKVLLFSAGYMFGTITLPRPPSVDAPTAV